MDTYNVACGCNDVGEIFSYVFGSWITCVEQINQWKGKQTALSTSFGHRL